MKYSNKCVKPDFKRNRYPFSIVWTPLPLISAFLPFIGHIGVCTEDGLIHDFSNPYTITIDDMDFGNPTKYVLLENVSSKWDEAVIDADTRFEEDMHNIFSKNCWFTKNCHSHVAHALNLANYEGKHWNMVSVWWMCLTRSKYVGVSGFIKTYIQSICLAILVIGYFFFR